MNPLWAIEFLPFGALIGVVARMLAVRRGPGKVSAGWAGSALVGGIGGVVGGLSGRGLGLWADEGPQGFALSLLGALAFVVIYHVLSMSRNARLAPDSGASSYKRRNGSMVPDGNADGQVRRCTPQQRLT
jgi:uncharacterized membrane protein YeaQ/YmgE (transglycosylase-associated protein family)